jgi:hypothetical protein
MAKDYIKYIDTEHGSLVFTLARIYTVNGIIFFTTVFGRSVQYFFHMEKRNGNWKIVEAPQPPAWITIHEEELAKFIEEKLNEEAA